LLRGLSFSKEFQLQVSCSHLQVQPIKSFMEKADALPFSRFSWLVGKNSHCAVPRRLETKNISKSRTVHPESNNAIMSSGVTPTCWPARTSFSTARSSSSVSRSLHGCGSVIYRPRRGTQFCILRPQSCIRVRNLCVFRPSGFHMGVMETSRNRPFVVETLEPFLRYAQSKCRSQALALKIHGGSF